MKRKNVKHGPLRITSIEVYPRMSEETVAFVAKVTLGDKTTVVENDGKGGAHRWSDYHVAREVGEYAKTLPPYKDPYGDLPYDADFLVSTLVEMAPRV